MNSTGFRFKDPSNINQNHLSPSQGRISNHSSTQRSSNMPPQNFTTMQNTTTSWTQRSSLHTETKWPDRQSAGKSAMTGEVHQDVSMNSGSGFPKTNVIDLESQTLSHKQVLGIHKQIKRDCSLLRNRVRMLKQEMEKANKKIDETH